jgi:ferredoxin-NADP reductase
MSEQLHNFELIEIRKETEDITSFRLKPLTPGFTWQAGQYLDWQLPHPDADDRGERRWFSIASAPSEGFVQLSCRFASEAGSSLKKHLQTLQIGAQVQAKGPSGEFTAEPDDMPLVLVAGGIGITPFRSILIDRAQAGTLNNITLIYGNKSADNIAFKDELDALSADHSGLKIHYITGQYITADLLSELQGGLDDKKFMISGLEKMVAAIEASLIEKGVDKQLVRIDDFGGYDWTTDHPIYQ